ncbi:alpha/beta hydrolase family protein [Nocardia camponoti]|uniref:Alpha/beta hydrolase n=1 Tax=Nocardia camponoti TaxID=1616106 RepID=A0A917QJ12_9NOCA|nr:alpha/beta family hydrolase [Nocardia camponoti]GGK52730.1 alpha/beta hydrolase [Nocardia camponoti]
MRIETTFGPAEVDLDEVDDPRFLLAITHGAGGGCDTKDIVAVADSAREAGGVVARITQPYRVAGRRAPGSAVNQDQAWREIIAALRDRFGAIPVMVGGRSNGARVACRTAVDIGAAGVVALSFPLHPPGKPEKSRRDELLATGDIDVVVINGGSDPFGVPDAADAAEVRVIPKQAHSFRTGFDTIAETVRPWWSRWIEEGGSKP